MPNFCETTSGHTVKRTSHSGSSFTTLWRAKDKQTRMRIALIANACCGKGLIYSNPRRLELKSFFEKKGNFSARLKAAQQGKIKGKHVDCSGFTCACTAAAGVSTGAATSGPFSKGGFTNVNKFKRCNKSKQFNQGTYQRGDIVAYPSKTKGGMGHVAIIASDGPNVPKNTFDGYYKDGTKKIKNPKTEKIRKHIKNYKTDLKKKKKKSKKALKNYLAKMKAERKTIKAKYKKWKNKKNKTEAQIAYTKKLKKALDKLNKKVIPAIEKAIRDYKEPKVRPKSKNTVVNDDIDWDEGTDDYDDEYNTETDTDNAEPVITPEKVDWYYVRSGLNYFSEEEIYDSKNQKVRHKDYMGKIYCKRKLKIPMINVTKSYWDFSFDMPFTSCSSYPAGIKSAAMVGGDTTKWRYYLNKNKMGQIQGGIYTIIMKTGSGIEYEIRCEIDTYYDV